MAKFSAADLAAMDNKAIVDLYKDFVRREQAIRRERAGLRNLNDSRVTEINGELQNIEVAKTELLAELTTRGVSHDFVRETEFVV